MIFMSPVTFSSLGCCPTRDIFNSTINNNYKAYFKLISDAYHQSFISLMSEPLIFNKNDVTVNGQKHIWADRTIADFERTYLEDLIKNPPEYLIFDVYADVEYGLLEINNTYVTNTPVNLQQTDFYKNLKEIKKLTIFNDTLKYLKIWKNSFEKFYNFMNDNCKSTQLILNPISYDINGNCFLLKKNKIEQNINFKILANKFNSYYKLLQRYICENFDLNVLLHDTYLHFDSHLWGLNPGHFEEKYYKEITFQLNSMINNYSVYSDELTEDIRKNDREKYLSILNKDLMINKLKYENNYLKKTVESSKSTPQNINKTYNKIYTDINSDNIEKYEFNLKSYKNVKNTELFDAEYYINNHNLCISKDYALLHYLNQGFKENLNPSEIFDGNKYLNMNLDVKKAGMNPLVHYELFGKTEGRLFPIADTFKLKKY